MHRWTGRWLALILGVMVALAGAELALRARYRHRALPPLISAEERVVVALGDSIAAGAPGDPGDAWPALLEQRLRDRYPALRWRVINAGAPGDTAPLGYQRFDADVARFGPDAVLIAFGLNDCNPRRYGLDLWWERRVPAGVARSYVWQAIRVRGERLASRLGWLAPPMNEGGAQPSPRTSPRGFSTTLTALTARTRAIGAQPVLLTMSPLADAPLPPEQAQRAHYAAYNERIRAAGTTERHPLVELAAGASAGTHEPDGIHLTVHGQAWIAEQVFHQLDAIRFWERLIATREAQ